MRYLLMLLLCALPLAQAEVYKTVDDQGRVTYTDQPSQAAEQVELRTTNITPAVSVPGQGEGETDRAPKRDAALAYRVFITSPAPETHLLPGDWQLPVSLAAEPALAAGHYFELQDNGAPVPGSDSASFTIDDIGPGEHQLVAFILDQNDRVLAESEPVRVYVHRARAQQQPAQSN